MPACWCYRIPGLKDPPLGDVLGTVSAQLRKAITSPSGVGWLEQPNCHRWSTCNLALLPNDGSISGTRILHMDTIGWVLLLPVAPHQPLSAEPQR